MYFWEEPVCDAESPFVARRECARSGVTILTPHTPASLRPETVCTIQKLLLNHFLRENAIEKLLLWYYTPMAREFSSHLTGSAIVFDCMDELSAFKGAPPEMRRRETELLRDASIVFTGGQSLYEAKLGRHSNLHCFPSSIEYDHFARARKRLEDPTDQAGIPRPRIGYCGVIDERLDLHLIAAAAALRPDLHFVMLGPVVKIDPATLPQASNIHYLGGKEYDELPAYLSNWNVAMLPFAHNESTRFISPTKTPEYLAAGLPVVSTSITDVVRPYGSERIARIADTPEEFVSAALLGIEKDAKDLERLARVDELLSRNSWDLTWQRMSMLIRNELSTAAEPAQDLRHAALLVAGN